MSTWCWLCFLAYWTQYYFSANIDDCVRLSSRHARVGCESTWCWLPVWQRCCVPVQCSQWHWSDLSSPSVGDGGLQVALQWNCPDSLVCTQLLLQVLYWMRLPWFGFGCQSATVGPLLCVINPFSNNVHKNQNRVPWCVELKIDLFTCPGVFHLSAVLSRQWFHMNRL